MKSFVLTLVLLSVLLTSTFIHADIDVSHRELVVERRLIRKAREMDARLWGYPTPVPVPSTKAPTPSTKAPTTSGIADHGHYKTSLLVASVCIVFSMMVVVL